MLTRLGKAPSLQMNIPTLSSADAHVILCAACHWKLAQTLAPCHEFSSVLEHIIYVHSPAGPQHAH